MYASRRSSRPDRVIKGRSGFTLIELLVAIAIIGILIAFLIPTIGGAINSVRVAEVQTEIGSLEKAITEFKVVFGVEPPSRITLYEEATGWAGDTASRAVMRQMFPQFDFGDHDINGDSDNTDTFNLSGAECLLFFLGGNGVIDTNPANRLAQGFSKNPLNPFASGGNRVGPFHEFVVARYTDVDSDDVPEYKDSIPGQTAPLLYLNSNNGRGYASPDSSALDDYDVYANGDSRNPVNAYYQDTALNNPWKPKSFQIISPGFDGAYGACGPFLPDGTSALPNYGAVTNRIAEWDNIANFHNGQLNR